MALIKVTSEDLANASSQLSTGSLEIDTQLNTMHNLVQELVASDWQGAASSSFETLYQEGYQKLSGASFRGSPSNC